MINANHQMSGKVRIEKIRRSSSAGTRVTSVTRSSRRSASTTRPSSGDTNIKEKNQNSSRQRSAKSSVVEDEQQRSRSAVHSVRVTKIQRPASQPRSNSHKTVDEVKKIKGKRSRIVPVDDEDRSTSTIGIIRTRSLGTVESVGKCKDGHHRSTKNRKIKNLLDFCCRCSLRRVLISLVFLILLGLLIALILLLKSKSTNNQSVSIPAFLRWNTTGITIYGTVGVRGNTSTQLSSPFDILFDSSENLYIADRYNHRVQKCSIRTSSCKTIAGQGNGLSGTNLSSLNGPTYMYLDNNNNLYIADSDNQRVQLWNAGASLGKTIAGTSGSAGSGLNQFNFPYGIALDSISNVVYIADYNNHRVMKYSTGNSTGTIVAGGNGLGKNNTQLYLPAGLIFDRSSNNLLIVNYGASNLVQWKLGDQKWNIFIGNSSGVNGNTSILLDHPTNLKFDPMGNLYVADMFNHRIQMYPAGQSNGTTIAGISGRSGTNATMLNYPVSMAFDNQLNLYVSDSLNHRIQKFLRY